MVYVAKQTNLQESITNTISSIVTLVSAIFVEKMIYKKKDEKDKTMKIYIVELWERDSPNSIQNLIKSTHSNCLHYRINNAANYAMFQNIDLLDL